MGLISLCDSHCRLEADGTATIGQNLIPEGSIAPANHVPGKFGNGFNNVDDPSKVYKTVINPTNPDNCIIAYWLKPEYNIINGAPDLGGTWKGHFSYWADGNNVFMLQSADFLATVIYFVVSGAWTYWRTDYDAGFGLLPPSFWNWSAGDKVSFIHCFNPAGIGGTSDTYRLYINGLLAFSTTIAGLKCPDNGIVIYGDMKEYGRPLYAVLDNPLIFHDTTQDTINKVIANMGNEYLPSDGKKMRNKFNRISGRFNI